MFCCGNRMEKKMKCVMCDNNKLLKKQKTTKKYKESGLDNVTLHGVEYYKCDKCGEEYYGYGDQESLHALIARVLILKKELLTGKEVRFLRTYLGYSTTMFASLTCYTVESISRFETNDRDVSDKFDILVRAIVALKLPDPDRDYDLHDLWLNKQGESYNRIELNAKRNGWSVELAA
jgi:putative zinc finger/helix-turn-helix YgiT family protein